MNKDEKRCGNCAYGDLITSGIAGCAVVCYADDEPEWRDPFETCDRFKEFEEDLKHEV